MSSAKAINQDHHYWPSRYLKRCIQSTCLVTNHAKIILNKNRNLFMHHLACLSKPPKVWSTIVNFIAKYVTCINNLSKGEFNPNSQGLKLKP
jgi:hypothetical protein